MAQRRLATLSSHVCAQMGSETSTSDDDIPLHWRLSQVPAGLVSGPRIRLTEAEKQQFYDDGFLILRGVVPKELCEAARKKYNTTPAKDRPRLFKSEEMLNLVTKSCVSELLHNEMGPMTDPIACQVAVTPPTAAENPGTGPWPEFGNPGLHMDGLWDGEIPKSQSELLSVSQDDPSANQPRDPAKFFGSGSPLHAGWNQVPLWEDPDKRLSIGSFTTFCFIAINDQTELGRGQTQVVKGAHHVTQEFFRWQAAQGGPVGPDGPGWPRLAPIGKDGVMINMMPKGMRDNLAEGAKQAYGWTWPKPTPVLMKEGDCCITLHACPHGASTNYGPDPRMNVIFRLRRSREGDPNETNPKRLNGLTDHPDRTYVVKDNVNSFLEYPDGYNPFKISVEKLCDHWSEWQGMTDVVARQKSFPKLDFSGGKKR